MTAKPSNHLSLNAMRQPLLLSGLVFYFAHIFQQAQASNATLASDPMMSDLDDVSLHDLENSQKTMTQADASSDDIPLKSLSLSSQAVPHVSLVVDEEESSDEVMTGKDAVDVSDGGVSPLLLLGGVALIGGGIAVLTNDDDSDSDEEVTVPTLTVPDIVVSEGDGIARVVFKLSQPVATDTEVTFNIITNEAYEGYDYSINSNSAGDDGGANRVTILAGELQAEYEIVIIDDYAGEMNKELKMLVETSSTDSFIIEDPFSNVTIIDNDLLFEMSSMVSYEKGRTFDSIDLQNDGSVAEFVTLSNSTGGSGGLAHVALNSDGVAVRTSIDTDVTGVFNNVTAVDLNGDGVDEVVVANAEDGSLVVYKYQPNSTNGLEFSSLAVDFSTNSWLFRAVEGFDVNDDGSTDIVVSNYFDSKMLALLNPGDDNSGPLDVSQWDVLSIDDGSDSLISYGYSNRITMSHADIDGDGKNEILTSFASGGDAGEGASFSYTYHSETHSFDMVQITDTGGRGTVVVDEYNLINDVAFVFDSSGTVAYVNDMGDVIETWDAGRSWVYEVGIEDIQHDGDGEVVVASWTNFAIGSNGMTDFRTLEELVTKETYIPLSSGMFAYEIIETDDATDSSIVILGQFSDNFGLWLLSSADRESADKAYEQTTLDISALSTFQTLSFSDVVVSEASETADITLTLDRPVNVAVAVDYTTSNDTALAGVDFMATQGQAVFEAGETAHIITVPIIDSSTEEITESFNLFLHSPQGVILDRSHVEITIEDNDHVQSAFTEDFSTGLDNWVVIADPVKAGAAFEYITDNLPSTIGMSIPEFTSVDNGYAIFDSSSLSGESVYVSMEIASPISLDPLTDANVSLESLYTSYEYDPYSAAVIVAFKTSEVEWVDFSEAAYLDLIKDAHGEGAMFDSDGNGQHDIVAFQLHHGLTGYAQSENPTIDSLTIPNEIYQDSGEVDMAVIFVGNNLFGLMVDDIEVTSGFTGETEVDLFG